MKDLATQTVRAAEEISGQIAQNRAATDQIVGAINAIKSTVRDINEISAAIAGAEEEQLAVMQEMSSSMQTASRSVTSISSMNDIARSAELVSVATMKVREASSAVA